MKRWLFSLLLAVSLPAQAFTPESGWWWNPQESGRGINLEIQDDVIVLSVYVYEPSGRPVWYLAVGRLSGNSRFTGELDRFENGQCITCAYAGEPDWDPGFAGPVEIEFTSQTTGVMTWRGGTVPIRRHNFALGDVIDKMLGQWQMVVDFSAANDGEAFYAGDVLTFDRDTTDGTTDFYEGFRPKTEFERTGSGIGDAAGLYEASTGLHVFVVDDSEDFWLAYYVTVGTNRFEGIAELYRKGTDPTGRGHPVEGFRNQSRAFVQTGRGPSKSAAPLGNGGGLAARVPAAALSGEGDAKLTDLVTLTKNAETAKAALAAARGLSRALAAERHRPKRP